MPEFGDILRLRRGSGAHNRTRTDDLFLTKEVLCQLSYVGQGSFELSGSELGGQEGNRTPTVEDS